MAKCTQTPDTRKHCVLVQFYSANFTWRLKLSVILGALESEQSRKRKTVIKADYEPETSEDG